MNTLLPLQIRTPDFSYPKVANAVQDYQLGEARLKNQQMDNDLAALRLGEATDLANAEKDFRTRSAAGDPNADEALAGHPEMQKKIWDAFDGMSPKDYKAAKKKATRFGDAARNILMFKDGSPEQIEAWNDEIGKLVNEEVIDQATGDRMIKGGPNPLIIEQALSVEQWAKSHNGKGALDAKKLALAEDKEKRLAEGQDDNSRRADVRLEIQEDRLKLAQEKADLDADRIKGVIEKQKTDSQARGDREDDKLGMEIEKAVSKYENDIGLNEADLETDDPDKFGALQKRSEAYRTRLLKRFGFGPDGRRLKSRALGTDKVADSVAKPSTFKVGQTATNKKTGEVVVWNGKSWEPKKDE